MAFANRISGAATALTTLQTRDAASADREIKALIKEWTPDALVIGVPYNMDGTESGLTTLAINFGTHLATMTGLPVDQVDERLTSAEAQMMLKEQRRTGQRRKKIRREDIDSLAAQLIAETWLRDTEKNNP